MRIADSYKTHLEKVKKKNEEEEQEEQEEQEQEQEEAGSCYLQGTMLTLFLKAFYNEKDLTVFILFTSAI